MLPTYVSDATDLALGASLGNGRVWIDTKSTGAIERVFSARAGASLFGAVAVAYGLVGQSIDVEPSHRAPSDGLAIALRADGATTVELHPAYQRRRFSLAGSIEAAETTFVPLAADAATGDAPAAYVRIELENAGTTARTLRVIGFARLRGSLAADIVATYDAATGALVAANPGVPRATRCFGATRPATSFATTTDFGRLADPSHLHALDGDTSATGDVLGGVQLDIELAPGARVDFAFVCGAFDAAADDAIEAYRELPQPGEALDATVASLTELVRIGEVSTPDRSINDGALWSKVNMRRVMSSYASGPAFTNEPGVSSNVVGRDAAWFVYGNDHFMPAFSRALLDTFARKQYASGKIPEYYSALDGHVEDDGLNINDDTPLYVLAVNHHARATGDLAWLRAIYASVALAADYILAQVDDRGLVFCTARDERGNVWAIAGWRNVIPGYTLNGAVTEINAECSAALRAAGHLAELADDRAGAERYASGARTIADAMRTHLLNPENGLYYLNIDADGAIHTDVTGDQVFPVMFRVCDEETGYRVIRRLNASDFWTSAGLRTVSQNDPRYDPSGNVGLLGGVWPGLTWWYAFAAARYHPEFMVAALGASFRHYAADPRKNNTVPGQFGEWFDGESLINRGMRTSPWEPPRFLWAAIEGVCGVMVTTGALRVAPLVPPGWKWVALKRLPYHGAEISFVAARHADGFHVYAKGDVESAFPTERYDDDISADVTAPSGASVVALARAAETLIFIGSHETATRTYAIGLGEIVERHGASTVETYDSERVAWHPATIDRTGRSGLIGISIEPGGYRLIRVRPAAAELADRAARG